MYFVTPIRPASASCIKPLASCIYSLVNQWKATLRNDVGFPSVYRRIYCRKFMTLSNQTSRCICKCIRIIIIIVCFKDTVFHWFHWNGVMSSCVRARVCDSIYHFWFSSAAHVNKVKCRSKESFEIRGASHGTDAFLFCFLAWQSSHPGSGSDRTIASERQNTAFATLYSWGSVTCSQKKTQGV